MQLESPANSNTTVPTLNIADSVNSTTGAVQVSENRVNQDTVPVGSLSASAGQGIRMARSLPRTIPSPPTGLLRDNTTVVPATIPESIMSTSIPRRQSVSDNAGASSYHLSLKINRQSSPSHHSQFRPFATTSTLESPARSALDASQPLSNLKPFISGSMNARRDGFPINTRPLSSGSPASISHLRHYQAMQRRSSSCSPNKTGSHGSNTDSEIGDVLTEDEVALMISEHLVNGDEMGGSEVGGGTASDRDRRSSSRLDGEGLDGDHRMSGMSFGSVSHGLLGGDVTRNIYRWKETRDIERQRRNSEPDLLTIPTSPSGFEIARASTLMEPGMFRRQFLQNKAQRERKRPPMFITRNFIDFLALYGVYGGDVYPSDDDEDTDSNATGFAIDSEDLVDEEMGRGGRSERLTYEEVGRNHHDGRFARNQTCIGTDAYHDECDYDHARTSETALLLAQSGLGTNGIATVPGDGGNTVGVHGTTSSSHTGTSESKAFFMLLKAFVGTGVLFLPKGFLNGGLGFSMVLLVVLGYLTLHCMILLVDTSRSLGGKSFGDIGGHIYGPYMRQLVLASIAISQMGFCCAYFIFVGQNLRDLLMVSSGCRIIWPDWVFILIQLAVYIPLSWVRRIKNFGITSLIADVFILLGLGYIFMYDLSVIGQTGIKPTAWINIESFSLFVGTAMFAFEGICLILPIAESMQHPQKFSSVLSWCILLIGTIFITIGTLGYMSFGDQIETVLFLNLPQNPLVNSIQFFYAVAIMLSFPLTIYPVIRITEQKLFGHYSRTGKSSPVVKWQKNLYRAVLACMLGVISWAGSTSLDKVVSLVGCFACIPLSFIYPALFHLHITTSWWARVTDWMLVGFGTVAMVYTTFVTLEQWAINGPDTPRDRCHDAMGTQLLELPSFGLW
ncbi:hypothetical protein QVD99_004668 [Batrachochytrium dendrobatidis]|nr:hypothetical protein QVD99_004668 [Batrachochytrium dendrobatidis]